MERFISVQYHGRNEMLMLGAANVCMSVSQHVSSACTWQRLQTCLPSWAVLHKALHLCQVYRSSLPHRFFLRETQWRFKVEIKKNTQRESSTAQQPLRKLLGSKPFLLYGPSPSPRKKSFQIFLICRAKPPFQD